MANTYTGTLNTITLPDFTDLVKREFTAVGERVKPTAARLFQKDMVGMNMGEFRLYEEYDQDTFASFKAQGANVAKARAGTGYEKQAKVVRYGKEIDITIEERKFNKYPQVIAKITDLSSYIGSRQEIDLTHRVTFATSTTYTNMDGQVVDITVGDTLALASASHTLKFSATTFSNLVSGAPAFSATGLEAAELIASTNIYNNFGEKRTMEFNTLFFADNPTVENEVMRVLQSTASVENYKNDGVVNVYKNKYTPVKLSYLATTALGQNDATKKNWWGLAACGVGAQYWQAMFPVWEERYLVDPISTPSLVDGHADIWTYGTRGSWATAIVSGRGFILSNAS